MTRVEQEAARSSPWLRAVDHFVPPAMLAAGGETRTRARILSATCLIGGALTLLGGSLSPLLMGLASGLALVNLVGGLAIVSGALLLRYSGSLLATAHVLMTVGWLMLIALFLGSEGTNLSVLYAFPMIPLIAVLIGGTATGLLWTLLSCLAAVTLVELFPNGISTSFDLAVANVKTQVSRDVVLITLWLALVGVLYDRVRGFSQRVAERALRDAEASEERFAQVFEGNPDGIVVAGWADRRVLECNQGFLEIVGQRRDEVVGRLDWTAAVGMDAAARNRLQETLEAKGACEELEFACRDRSLRVRARRIELDGQRSVLATVQDVTERIHLEEQLRQAQKMEAVGRLAGAIAHDFNNMLTVIAGYAEHLSDRLADESGEMAREIHRAADRSADLTRQLLAFSRRQVMKPRILDLNDMIRGLERLLGRLLGEPIRVVLELDPGLGSVRADPGQMEQVLVNLAINARDAMRAGGTLHLTTENFDGAPGAAGRRGRWVCLRVRDDGVGMDEATLHRAFEPFFTTKEQGKGTGLGLSTVDGIVSQSGGEITIRSGRGSGTVVEVFLPRVDGAHEDTGLATVSSSAAAGVGHTVLLVEDDEMVRRLASRCLGAAGYEVIEACDGEDALEIFRSRGGAVDLVLSDVVMPRRGGPELVEDLRKTRPELPVLLMSGYPNAREDHGRRLPADVDLVHKPFSPESLRERVAAALGRPASHPG